jgi:hypothetical protein
MSSSSFSNGGPARSSMNDDGDNVPSKRAPKPNRNLKCNCCCVSLDCEIQTQQILDDCTSMAALATSAMKRITQACFGGGNHKSATRKREL